MLLNELNNISRKLHVAHIETLNKGSLWYTGANVYVTIGFLLEARAFILKP